jgi:lysozyme
MVQVKIDAAGIEHIKQFEDFRAEMYLDSANKPTIGYGTLITQANAWLMNAKLTKAEALELLMDHVRDDARVIQAYVHVQLTQNQVNALHSFIYNLGREAFRISTLRKRINEGASIEEIMYQFSRWNKVTKNGVKVAIPGLTTRRAEEAAMYAGNMSPKKKEQ